MRVSPLAIWRGDVGAHRHLVFRLLAAVGVRGVDHQARCQAVLGDALAGFFHAGRIVIGRLAATQDDVAILVAGGGDDRRMAALGHREEMMRLRRGLDRIDGDLDVAVGAILEADRARQAGRQFAVHLRFGGAGADRTPAHQVGEVLRADHVEELGAGRQADLVDFHQQFARHAQAVVDAEAVIHEWIVDQAFPADRGARLFEIHAHDHFQLAGEFRARLDQQVGVFDRRLGIVDGAWADDHHQAVVLTMQDAVQCGARIGDDFASLVRAGKLANQVRRGSQFFQFSDPQIVSARHHFLLKCLIHVEDRVPLRLTLSPKNGKKKTAITGGFFRNSV